MKISVEDDQRDRLYAMAREAQLRGIQPFALKKESGEKEDREERGCQSQQAPQGRQLGLEKDRRFRNASATGIS